MRAHPCGDGSTEFKSSLIFFFGGDSFFDYIFRGKSLKLCFKQSDEFFWKKKFASGI